MSLYYGYTFTNKSYIMVHYAGARNYYCSYYTPNKAIEYHCYMTDKEIPIELFENPMDTEGFMRLRNNIKARGEKWTDPDKFRGKTAANQIKHNDYYDKQNQP